VAYCVSYKNSSTDNGFWIPKTLIHPAMFPGMKPSLRKNMEDKMQDPEKENPFTLSKGKIALRIMDCQTVSSKRW
jgi:hypothetical protein